MNINNPNQFPQRPRAILQVQARYTYAVYGRFNEPTPYLSEYVAFDIANEKQVIVTIFNDGGDLNIVQEYIE